MGLSWESAVFRQPGKDRLDELASAASEILPRLRNPIKVFAHFMFSPDESAISGEITAFRRKRIAPEADATRDLASKVMGSPDLQFDGAEVLLAETISRVLGVTAAYLYENDAYGASAYAAFDEGKLRQAEVYGWHGADMSHTFGLAARVVAPQGLVSRGWRLVMSSDLESTEDLFETFYSEDSPVVSYLLMEQREKVWPPLRLP